MPIEIGPIHAKYYCWLFLRVFFKANNVKARSKNCPNFDYFILFPQKIANEAAHPLALKATLLCLMTAPSVNSFLFGFRNKSVQMIVLNYMRKEFYKNEVQQEIRLRSPGQPSTRPSVTSIVGQITCQVPYLQRQVSVASLGPVSFIYTIPMYIESKLCVL